MFELAIKMNGWTYLKHANHLACALTEEADNFLSQVLQASDAVVGRLVLSRGSN